MALSPRRTDPLGRSSQLPGLGRLQPAEPAPQRLWAAHTCRRRGWESQVAPCPVDWCPAVAGTGIPGRPPTGGLERSRHWARPFGSSALSKKRGLHWLVLPDASLVLSIFGRFLELTPDQGSLLGEVQQCSQKKTGLSNLISLLTLLALFSRTWAPPPDPQSHCLSICEPHPTSLSSLPDYGLLSTFRNASFSAYSAPEVVVSLKLLQEKQNQTTKQTKDPKKLFLILTSWSPTPLTNTAGCTQAFASGRHVISAETKHPYTRGGKRKKKEGKRERVRERGCPQAWLASEFLHTQGWWGNNHV